MRALIVEDDFGSRRMMQKLVTAYGDCDVVVDGEEAVEAFLLAWEDFHPYDVVFMDIMMPKVDGQEALVRIRAIEKDMGIKPVNEVRIIMTTVLEDPKNVMEALNKGGATAYMVKPITRDKLKAELDKMGYRPRE